MAVELTYPHIVKEPAHPARLERHPRTRVAMIVADYVWRGWSVEEIVRQWKSRGDQLYAETGGRGIDHP